MQAEKKSILDEIVEHKTLEVEAQKKKVPFETFILNIGRSTRDFRKAILRPGKEDAIRLIAELKFASPASGKIRDASKDEIVRITKLYNKYASAISVLTDEKYFGGSVLNLRDAARISSVPILRKDFIVDKYQIVEARYYGADAILLIASVLGEQKLKSFMGAAKGLGMACLVEVHDKGDLDVAIRAGADIIGINNRDLKTMDVDVKNTLELSGQIPDNVVVVSESGIRTKEDVERLREANVDAVLVGTAIMEGDVEDKLKELIGDV
ncbi:MAG: indole-3-glycerol phosphate synthase TrpC [archaeon]